MRYIASIALIVCLLALMAAPTAFAGPTTYKHFHPKPGPTTY